MYGRAGGGGGLTSAARSSIPTQTVKKSVSYVAGGADSNLVISISGTDASDAITSEVPSAVEITNTGVVPTIVISNTRAIVTKIQMQEGILFKLCLCQMKQYIHL